TKALLFQFLPILHWLPQYPVKEWLLGDIVSGISVGILQLPQGLAYALLAGVPPVFGLYSSFFPVFVYSFFGTSRHVSVGSFAVVSIMIGSVTESLAPNENFILPGNETIDTIARDRARVEYMAAITLLVGLFQLFLGLVQFGFVVTYLSEPLVRGYTTAATIHVTVSQLKHILGLPLSERSQPLSLFYSLVSLLRRIHKTNIGTLVVSAVALVFLFAVKEINHRFHSKLCMPIPTELVVELIALGLSNLTGSFFHCFAVTSSMSRSLVQESTGGNTQIAGSISAIIILVIILKAGELFTCLPRAILSSIVIANLKGMYKQFMDIPLLWWTDRYDLLIWLATFLSTICLNLDMGLGISVVFGLVTVTFRTQLPHYSLLGQVAKSDIYRVAEEKTLAKELPGVKIFQSNSPLYFANAELYAKSLKMKMAVDVDKLIEKKKKAIQKRKKALQKVSNLAESILAKTQKGSGMEFLTNKEVVIGSLKTLSESIPQSPVTLRSLGLEKPDFHSLILDFSAVCFIDTVGTKILKNIFNEFREVEVEVFIANCPSAVLRQLENGSFFNDDITPASIFASIHDAVSYICSGQNSRASSLSEITAV
ncbi:hypothetical protein GDO78_009390, partial [Eleutherodactylus coqui]